MMRFEKWVWLALAAAVALVVIWPRGSVLRAGTPAPPIAAQEWINTAAPWSMESLAGRIVVLEFWATWCPPCRQAVPHLNALYNQWRDRGVVVIGLSDEPPDRVRRFVVEAGVQYAVGAGSLSGREYAVQTLPEAVVIDRSGRVVWRGHPEGDLDRALAEAAGR